MEISTTLSTSIFTANRSKLLVFLFFIRLGSVASYSVMFSTLSLYLVDHFNLTKTLSSNLVGIFVAFVYILPLIGGVLGQRLLPYRTLFITGVSMQIIAALLLSINNLAMVYWGLASFLMGNMVSSLSVNMLITQAYKPEEVVERKAAFLWNYSGMNVGFLVGYVCSGIFQLSSNYSGLFMWVAFFSALSVILMVVASKVLLAQIEGRNPTTLNVLLTIAIMVTLISVIHFILIKAYLSKAILLNGSIILFVGVMSYLYVTNKNHRPALRVFSGFTLLSLFFWSIYMLTPTSLMLFVQDYVKTTYGIFHIPPQWLDIIDAGILIIFAPCLAIISKHFKKKYHYSLTTARSFQFGFLLYVLGISALLFAMFLYNPPLSIIWIASYMAIQALAEAFIGPSGYALIGEILPEKIRSVATGLWMMTLGIAGLIASGISNIAFVQIDNHQNNGIISFQHTFLTILILGLVALCFITITQRFLQTTKSLQK